MQEILTFLKDFNDEILMLKNIDLDNLKKFLLILYNEFNINFTDFKTKRLIFDTLENIINLEEKYQNYKLINNKNNSFDIIKHYSTNNLEKLLELLE